MEFVAAVLLGSIVLYLLQQVGDLAGVNQMFPR